MATLKDNILAINAKYEGSLAVHYKPDPANTNFYLYEIQLTGLMTEAMKERWEAQIRLEAVASTPPSGLRIRSYSFYTGFDVIYDDRVRIQQGFRFTQKDWTLFLGVIARY